MRKKPRFPALMKTSQHLSFIAFLCAFPLSIIADLYGSFGNFSAYPDFVTIRLSLLFLVTIVAGLNLAINTSHWLRLFSFNCYLLLLLYIVVVVLINWDLEGYVNDEFLTAGDRFSPILVLYIAHSALGLSFTQFKPFRWILLLSFAVASVVVLQHVDYYNYRIDINNYVDGANKGNYLFIGDAYALTALLVFAYFQNGLARFILFLASLVVLFCIGSRTSFAVFGLTGLVFILVSSAQVKLIAALTALLVTSAVALGTFNTSINVVDLAERNSRMTSIFTDYYEDNSIIARQALNDIGWEDISNNPIAGKFGGQRDVDDWNGYMHNFTSYWRQFGIVPFTMLLSLYVLFFILCLRMLKHKDNLLFTVPLLLGTFIIVESLVSRSFVFVSAHLLFGLLISFQAWNSYGSSVSNSNNNTRRRRRRSKTRSPDHGV